MTHNYFGTLVYQIITLELHRSIPILKGTVFNVFSIKLGIIAIFSEEEWLALNSQPFKRQSRYSLFVLLIKSVLVLIIMLCIINTQYLHLINTASSLALSHFERDSKPEKMRSFSSISINKAKLIRKFSKDYVHCISFSCYNQQNNGRLLQNMYRNEL